MFIDACEDNYDLYLSAHLLHSDAWQINPDDGGLFLDAQSGNLGFFFEIIDVLIYRYPEVRQIVTGENPGGSFEFNVREPGGTLEYRFKIYCTPDPDRKVKIRRVKRVDKETVL